MILAPESKISQLLLKFPDANYHHIDSRSKSTLKKIKLIESDAQSGTYILSSNSYKKLKQKFKSHYVIVDAAGGLVINEHNEGLFIYKRGKWDLPKGKLESTESLKEAALREVKEETGVSQLKLGQSICKTKHTYKTKSGKRAIKRSYWYIMYAPKQKVVPQEEEDIEIVQWIDLKKFATNYKSLYQNLVKVLKKYHEIMH